MLFHFYLNTLNQGFLTHRFYDTGRSKNRDATLDSQTGIKSLFRDLFTFWNRNRYFQATLIVVSICCILHCFQDHGLWHRIDCCFSHFLWKSRTRHSSDTFPSIDRNLRGFRTFFHSGIDQNSIRRIRIIPRIFTYCADHCIFFHTDVMQFQMEKNSLWCHKICLVLFLTSEKHFRGTFCSSRRTGSGRIAEMKFLLIFNYIIIFQSCFMCHNFLLHICHFIILFCQKNVNETPFN